MAETSMGRVIPDAYAEQFGVYGDEFGNVKPYAAAPHTIRPRKPGESKLLKSIHDAIVATGLKDGMTISFHHHLREGDYVMNMVIDEIAKMGIRDISIAPSSIANVHAPLIDHIKNGVVTHITSSGLRDKLGAAISEGIMDEPVIIRSHGGRARAIESGAIHIDVAFLAVPCCDEYGNANGTEGKSACGSLGYALMDAKYADQVVLITDNLVPYLNNKVSIPQTEVDYVVPVEAIGDPAGISKGAIRVTKNPKELIIAENAAKVIMGSPYFKDGFSFQTGTGGASLAVTNMLRDGMIEKGIKASFALGGITNSISELFAQGLIETLTDVQDFDTPSGQSLGKNAAHLEVDASWYASPFSKGAMVNRLDTCVLSALEIDTDFNVNVLTGSDGVIRGASGGHSDAAAGAKLTIVVAPLIRGRIPTVVDSVNTVVTPGASVDVLVTELGIAVNPLRQDLVEAFKGLRVPQYSIEELRDKAYAIVGSPKPIEYGDQVVALVEYRDGTLIDAVRNV